MSRNLFVVATLTLALIAGFIGGMWFREAESGELVKEVFAKERATDLQLEKAQKELEKVKAELAEAKAKPMPLPPIHFTFTLKMDAQKADQILSDNIIIRSFQLALAPIWLPFKLFDTAPPNQMSTLDLFGKWLSLMIPPVPKFELTPLPKK